MAKRRNWILIGSAATIAVALGLGVPLTTILLICLVLACPAAVYFGMRGGRTSQKHLNQNDE